MNADDRYDSLIQYFCGKYFPEIDWLVVKAQVAQESGFDSMAASPAGCLGLMQISEAVSTQYLREHPESVLLPSVNLSVGIRYLKLQYDHFPEIPKHHNRYMFALAAYNCGRGYVNAALRLAREDEGRTSKQMGLWQTWGYSHVFLGDDLCMWRAKRPDFRQVIEYVERIMERYNEYLHAEEETKE